MSILFLARKLACDYGFIEQSQNRNQMNYRFYLPRPDRTKNTNQFIWKSWQRRYFKKYDFHVLV